MGAPATAMSLEEKFSQDQSSAFLMARMQLKSGLLPRDSKIKYMSAVVSSIDCAKNYKAPKEVQKTTGQKAIRWQTKKNLK